MLHFAEISTEPSKLSSCLCFEGCVAKASIYHPCVEVWQQIKWKTLLDNCYRTCRRFGGENQNWRCAGGSKWWYLKCQPPVSPSASYCLFSHSQLLLWTAAAIYCQLCCQDLITPPGSWQWDWASEDVSGHEIFLDSKGKTVSKERKRWDKASQARLKTQVQLCPLKIQRKKCPGSEEGGLKLFKREGNPCLDPPCCHAVS